MAQPTQPVLVLPSTVVDAIRLSLPTVAEHVVTAIIEEVPSYTDAFSGRMGATIREAVQVALGGFLTLAGGKHGTDLRAATSPTAPARAGAYELGRGEARSGRTTEAILSAYRIGAREAWAQMAGDAVRVGLDAETLAAFAGLVFAYIDALSASSVAGHTDELAKTGRVRQRQLERLAQQLLDRAPEAGLVETAERADWTPPTTLTAVLAPESQLRGLLAALSPATLQAVEAPGLEDDVLLFVPDAHGRGRGALLRSLDGSDAVAGPARPWVQVRTSYDRVLRARSLGLLGDTEAHLPTLVLTADPDALADLRTRVLAPLAGLRDATAEKLTETLRAWLLHQGRRDDVAAALFVHPQTVRYRMGQLREAYGDRLDDPATVLALTVALGVAP